MVMPTDDYDLEDEKLEFIPGSVVVCEEKCSSFGPILVAKRTYDE